MKVIETQQQAYMLDNNTKEIPDVQTLRAKDYITEDQKKAYENRQKTPEQ